VDESKNFELLGATLLHLERGEGMGLQARVPNLARRRKTGTNARESLDGGEVMDGYTTTRT
jgi:hypothetical protein